MMTFRDAFGPGPSIKSEACGRVNLIGEHTDYNDGFVLPALIPQRTQVELRVRDDEQVRFTSPDFGTEICEYRLGEERRTHHWADYARGVTALLRQAGYRLRGFEAMSTSTVPVGSGLSSSAAFQVALLRALREAFALSLDDVALALLCQKVENEFVGARVGIMDPMVISVGAPDQALFIDTRDLQTKRIPLPLNKMDLVVINSGVAHRNAGGDYNTRRAECEEACRLLGIKSLRELGTEPAPVEKLPDPFRWRARHVVTENARVCAAVSALENQDIEQLGELFLQSHRSMRDDYQVSVPEIDFLVETSRADRAVYGARLTGGGFGGSIVMLAKAGEGGAAAERLTAAYRSRYDLKATVLVP